MFELKRIPGQWRFIPVLFCVLSLLAIDIQIAHADVETVYVVQGGDTLIEIALRHGVSLDALAAANGLDSDAWVYAGQQIVIPSDSAGRSMMSSQQVTRAAFLADDRIPNPMPPLPALSQVQPGDSPLPTYARVVQDNVPVYGHPSEADQGLPPKRQLGSGFIWVSVQGQTRYAGRDYIQINPGEYVLADALSLYQPSTFQGVALTQQPERPFAWILQSVQPLLTPGGAVNPDAPVYQRYDLVQIFATERLGDQVWYLVGSQQWINQIYVGKVAPVAPPEGMSPGAAWIQIDLFEQTLAAYEGERMVYATLVSSGLPGWDTPQGLFQVWLKVRSGKMSGAHNRPDYYFLEDVPWTIYFNKDVGLHTAYWHDGFGYKHSHGCVNLAPRDARWLFEWATEDAWVWVQAGN